MKGIIISFLLALAVAAISYFLYVPYANVPWDEAGSLFWGYRIFSAIKVDEWHELVSITVDQVYPPPVQSWFIGIASLFFPFSITNVRTANLLWLLFTAILLYMLGEKLGGNVRKRAVALLSVIWFLLSPMTFLMSAIALREMMGAALTLLFLLWYLRADENRRVQDYAIAAVIWFILFFTKYQYGAIILLGVGINHCINLATKQTRKTFAENLFWAIIIGTSALWAIVRRESLFHSYYSIFASYFLLIPSLPGGILPNVLFYPRSFIYFYSVSPWLGYILILSIVMSAAWLKEKNFRLIWISTILYTFFMALNIKLLADRYLFTISPLFFIIFSRSLVYSAARCAAIQSKRIRYVILVACIAFSLTQIRYFVRLPRYVYAMGSYTLRSPTFNQPDYADLLFDYRTSRWAWQLPPAHAQTPKDVIAYIVANVDPRKEVKVKGRVNELSPVYIRVMTQLAADTPQIPDSRYSHFVVTIEVLPESPLYNRDYLVHNKELSERQIRDFHQESGYRLLNSRLFEQLGVRVKIYGAL